MNHPWRQLALVLFLIAAGVAIAAQQTITLTPGETLTVHCGVPTDPPLPDDVPDPEPPPGEVLYSQEGQFFQAQPGAAQWGRRFNFERGQVREWVSGDVLSEPFVPTDPKAIDTITFQVDFYIPELAPSDKKKVSLILWSQDGKRWRDRVPAYATLQVPASSSPRLQVAANWGLGKKMNRAFYVHQGQLAGRWIRYRGTSNFRISTEGKFRFLDNGSPWYNAAPFGIGQRQLNGERFQVVLGMPEGGRPHEVPGYGWQWANLYLAVERQP